MSIFLEAIQRLVEPQEVQNPKLVCIVGCFGLASNILGLLLFHDHSHGGHGHDHSGEDLEDVDAAEQGYGYHGEDASAATDERDPALGPDKKNHNAHYKGNGKSNAHQRRGSRRLSTSTGRAFAGDEGIHVYPATLRQDIIAASRNRYVNGHYASSSDSELDRQDAADTQPSERSGLLRHKDRASNYTDENGSTAKSHPDDSVHKDHNHAQPKPTGKKKGGHDLNMRGVFLHVFGDALGNIGVIVSALIIWLTDYSWRYYVDPGISLFITVVILCSAIPLCKAASRILLQAAPPGMSIDHIKEDIENLPGVIGSHHLHVWQLSDTKIVASIHIKVDTEIKGEGSERYMRLAKQVRKCLHAYGIHSSTIQPEFAPDSDTEDNNYPSNPTTPGQANGQASSSADPSRAASFQGDPKACLLECGDECARGGQCCPK